MPPAYAESEREWPAIIFLHGAGERGRDPEIVRRHGLPKIVEQQPDFPFIVISPQCPANQWWSLEWLDALFDEVIVRYRIDLKRIYLTGLSMGGFATWTWANEHPERFAALVPICGGGNPLEVHKIKTVPAWVFHGAKDDVVPLHKSKEMVAALKAYGGNVRLTVYPSAGHDSWTKTYYNPNLY
ncbi:MAG: prolyl oligopeptidase family serine peptidase [Candidatus Neomarinimicrobiota bacterium]